MNVNEKFVITVNRELGSGGRTVGRKLAEKLGVEYYDKALIKGHFKRKMTDSFVYSNYYIPKPGDEPELLETDEVFKTETEILKGIAADESCVVAGRSGFYVFRDHPNHMSILIQASMDFRVERVSRKQGMSPEEARKVIDNVDKMRENYVNRYTKSSRYDTRNYDLVISADGKTEDEIVEFILQYMGK